MNPISTKNIDVASSKELNVASVATTSSMSFSASSNVVSTEPATKYSVVQSTSSNTNYLTSPANVHSKRIIRKITPIDPKKLQQAGLDRKIAEALSKQKAQQANSKVTNRSSNVQTFTATKISSPKPITDTAVPSVVEIAKPTAIEEAIPAKCSLPFTSITPPKITITGPEAPTEEEKQNLNSLNAHQRLVHVKSLLNKKLLQKKNTLNNDNVQTYKHLKPPPPMGVSPQYKTQLKLPVKHQVTPVTQNHFVHLKEPANASTPPPDVRSLKTQTLQKSPQDIARKLDFQTEVETTNFVQTTTKRNYVKCLSKDMDDIPKASIKAVNIFPSNTTQTNRSLQIRAEKIIEAMPVKQNNILVSDSPQESIEYLKPQKITNEIPKASIKAGHTQPSYTYPRKKIDFPEVSPLKMAFPTVKVPKETPLPAIDSFKKPYPIITTSYYDLQHKMSASKNVILANKETSLLNQQQTTTSHINFNNNENVKYSSTTIATNEATTSSAAANCLIVLENKVLSQDEMIDLTELRLSTSKCDTPRFVNPHKPIPEVVIKQENTEEYPSNNMPTPVIQTPEVEIPKEIPTQNNEALMETVVISNKQNKKIIINAQKLKLPPEQLADLAKKIKQRSDAFSPLTKDQNPVNKVKDIRILNTKASSRKPPANYTSQVVKQNTEFLNNYWLNKHNPKEVSDKYIIQHKLAITEINAQDFKYQDKPMHQDSQTHEGIKHFFIRHNSDKVKQQTSNYQTLNEHIITVKEEPKLQETNDTSQHNLLEIPYETNTFESSAISSTAVEIMDNPFENEDCFSAVDFIAALSNTNPTNEKSILELSLEERNLSASCAINISPLRAQSYPLCNNTQYIPTTSTPKIHSNNELNDNSLEGREMSTIVIESSKGPETILTNESSNKKTSKLQTVKVLKNMDIEKVSEASLTYNNPKKLGDPKEVQNQKCLDRNALDNMKICDMNIVISEHERGKPKTLAILGMGSRNSDAIKSSYSKIQKVAEPIKNRQNIDITNVIVTNNQVSLKIPNEDSEEILLNSKEVAMADTTTSNTKQEFETATISSSHSSLVNSPKKSDKDLTDKEPENLNLSRPVINISEKLVKTADAQTEHSYANTAGKENLMDLRSLEKIENKNPCDKTNPRSTTNYIETVAETPLDSVIVTNNKIHKLTQDTDASKTAETNSNTAGTSKRISRLKKGKINLVQRSKAGQGSNKTLTDEKNEPPNKDKKIGNENNLNDNLDKQCREENNIKRVVVLSNELNNGKTSIETNKTVDPPVIENPESSYKQHEERITETETNICNPTSIDKSQKTTKSALIAQEASCGIAKTINHQPGLTLEHENEMSHNILPDTEKQLNFISAPVTNPLQEQKEKHLNNDILEKPKASITTDSTTSEIMDTQEESKEIDYSPQKLTNSPHKSRQEKIHSPKMGIDSETSELHDISNDTSEINEKTSKTTKSPETQENAKNLTSLSAKNIDHDSKEMMKNIKKAKVSLVDIIKHSPIKQPETQPVIPFKKKFHETNQTSSESKGLNTLLKHIKSSKNETQENLPDLNDPHQMKQTTEAELIKESPLKRLKESKKSLVEVDDEIEAPKVTVTKKAIRSSLRKSDSQLETPLHLPASTRKRHSARPLISDDDLEFLPENAELKFKLSKSKLNEKKKDSVNEPKTTTLTSSTLGRCQRLYSKPLELELPDSISPLTKRTRYYSQTLETNVTITFDTLKSKRNLNRNLKPLKTEDSCQDSKQDFNVITPNKQRKKLRKTLEDIKKSQKSHNESDSEDDNRDYDCVMKEFEESNEFLGFEEKTDFNSLKNTQQIVKRNEDNDREAKTKHGILKNWLTTGKAISPTFTKGDPTHRLRHDEELISTSTSVIRNSKGVIPFKKRWDLVSNRQEETDITDDTSPAEDEEDSGEQIQSTKRFKRGIKDVIDSNKVILDSKKIKLDDSIEHSFLKPRHLRTKSKNSGTDSECHEEKPQYTQKHQLKIKSFENNLPKIKTSEKNVTTFKSKEDKNSKSKVNRRSLANENLDTETDYQKEKRFEVTAESSGSDSNWQQVREPRRSKKENVTDINFVKNPGIHPDYHETDEINKNVKNVSKVITETSSQDSDKQRESLSRRFKCKIKTEDLDKSLDESKKPNKTDSDCPKSKRSLQSISKTRTEVAKVENLDIPNVQKHVTHPDSSNKFIKTEDSVMKQKSQDLKDQDTVKTNLGPKTSTLLKNEDGDNDNFSSFTILSKSCSTPQNVTNKRKRRNQKENSSQIFSPSVEQTDEQNTLKNEPNSEASSSQMFRKKVPDSADVRKCNSKNSPQRKFKIEDSDSDSTATPLKNNIKSKNVMDNLTPIATPRLGLVKTDTPCATVRKKRISNVTEPNFNPRLLLITKRAQLDTDEILTETKPGTGAIQCGLCLKCTQPAKWIQHLTEHYGVGWKVGEKELHVENRSVVLNNIISYMKENSCKGLICRMCQKVYRSALGLLMHIEGCGAQATRVICEYCKKDYAKTTLPIHMRSCYVRTALENHSDDNNVEKNNEKKVVFGNTGRLKRNSTLKAESKLKVLEAELENVADNVKTEKPDIDPKLRIKYVAKLEAGFDNKWSKDINELGHASCPKSRCKFTSINVKELSKHLKDCKYNKSGYFCNFCRQRMFESEKAAIEHVIKSHQSGRRRKKSEDSDCDLKIDDEQSSDDDLSEGVDENELDCRDDVEEDEDDFDDVINYYKKSDKEKKTKKPYSRILNQTTNPTSRKEVFDGRFTDLNKEVLRKWKNFLKQNYSSEPLFAELKAQYSVINNSDFYKYLPSQSVSMKFNLKNQTVLTPKVGVPEKNIEWSELKRFENFNNKNNTYFFLGAPVKYCSWLPVPDHIAEQYLAVVYRQDMMKYVKFSQPKQHHTIILILKITQNNNVQELNVHYGFSVTNGPVHHVSFLPSGGYDESSNRLGLVAVATVTSNINVFSLPLNVENATASKQTSSIQDKTKVIEIKPSFILNLDLIKQNQSEQHVLLNPQCLQICWSEFSGHQHIFASFSNGFLGIWDIINDTEQNLNCFLVDDIVNYAPLNYFYVGEKGVKNFALHYDTFGPRWLAVSGAYRKFVIYDIKIFMQPIIMKEEINKNILLSMDWCPLWETVLYSYCDSIPNNGRCVTAVNPANIMFPQNKLDIMVCGVTQVQYTPLANMCVSALDNGDILFLDTKELHYECALSKKFGERRMLYTMDVKQLNGQPLAELAKGNQKNNTSKAAASDWQMHYDNYKQEYGLIFQSLIKLKENDKKAYLSADRCPPVNMIPLMRINTLRCNFNLKGKNLIALGYENGFIRLVNFKKETIFCN